MMTPRGRKEVQADVKEEYMSQRPSLKEIINRVQKSSGSMCDSNKEERFFTFNFPSINQLDLEMRMEDFNEEHMVRPSKEMVGSMIKIEEEWNEKEKDYEFGHNL